MKTAAVIGWREWVQLPDWGLRMRAKADTGARSSAIDCAEVVEVPGDRVRFTVRLNREALGGDFMVDGSVDHWATPRR